MASSSSTPESVDAEKQMMKNLKFKEKVEENFSVTEAGASSKQEEDEIMELKNLKIQEAGQSSKSDEGEEVYGTPKSDFGDEPRRSCFFGMGSSSKGKNQMRPKSVVLLKSSEGDVYEVEESIAMLSQTIKHMIEDGVVDGDEIPIPLTNISSGILERVLVYLEKHVEKVRDEDEVKELKKWDEEFVDGFKDDQQMLFGMILAANFLAAECLMDVTCRACANLMEGKSPEWIREYFGIKNDFTPEEEAQGRREQQAWNFGG